MSSPTTGTTCRLTVVGPMRRIDTAVPAGVPLVDMLPTLLAHLGADLADRGLDHGGWVLQRLGEPPLDEDLTPDELGLLDGDVLHLRARDDLVPPIDFDDLVDGVATGMRRRSGLWQAATTRVATTVAVHLILLAGVVLLALPDPAAGHAVALTRAVAAWVAAGCLLATPLFRSRGHGRDLDAALTAAAASGFALVGALHTTRLLVDAGAPAGLARTAAGVLTAAVAVTALLTVTGPTRPVLVGLGAGAAWAVLAAAVAVGTGSAAAAAAAVLVLTAITRPAVPRAAFQLAGLALDPLPTTPDDLQRGIDPQPGEQTLAAAAAPTT